MNQPSDDGPIAGRILGGLAVLAMLAAVCLNFLLPSVGSRPASNRTVCLNNLRNVGLALIQYAENNHGRFPPAYVADKSGRPIHSWRTAILGFLEYTTIARMYRWDAPWNSPDNSRLGKECPIAGFRCPSDPGNACDTSYVVIVGPHTLFPGRESRGPDDIKRAAGAAETLLVVELPASKIHWMEPRDLKYEDAIRGIGPSGKPISSVHSGMEGKKLINVCFADGHAQAIPLDEFVELVKKHARIDEGPAPSPPPGPPPPRSTQ